MDRLVMSGIAIVLLGLLGFAVPVFTTQKTEEVARVGDLKLQTTENTSHVVPPILSGGAVLIGLLVVGAGLYKRT